MIIKIETNDKSLNNMIKNNSVWKQTDRLHKIISKNIYFIFLLYSESKIKEISYWIKIKVLGLKNKQKICNKNIFFIIKKT